MTDRAPHPRSGAATVVAVVVAGGPTAYLTETLRSLAQQSRMPADILLVATTAGDSHPPSAAELGAADLSFPDARLHRASAPDAATFGEAVTAGLATVPELSATWLWLLHDDSAPDPDALAALLRAVELAPSVVVAGVKQRQWANPARLVEAGVTTSRFGRRMTGVEPDEIDQGQHDGREDVLAVGLAGALVRRDVWTELGGTDRGFGRFGDGYDFCRRARLAGHRVLVVPQATVRHAQLSLQGVRDVVETTTFGPDGLGDPRRSFRARRQSLIYGELISVPALLIPVIAVIAVGSGLARSLARLLTKEPGLAVAELAAPVAVLARPGRIARARATARATRRLPRRALRPLQVGARDVFREARDRRLAAAEQRRTSVARSELEMAERAQLDSRRRAGLGLLLAGVIAGTVAALGPLIGHVLTGRSLAGGALLPSTAGFSDLYRAATAGWVATDLGHPGPADPLLAVLLPFTALTRSVSATSGFLMLGALVLAGWGGWAAAGAATRSNTVRIWAALGWAAAPSLLVAVSAGRLGAVLAHLALPWLVLGVARALGLERRDVIAPGAVATDQAAAQESNPARAVRASGSLAAAAGAAIALAVAAAGAPVLLPVLTVLMLLVALVVPHRRARIAMIPVPALVLFGPLIAEALTGHGTGGWRALVADPGLPVDSVPAAVWQFVLGWPTASTAPAGLAAPFARVLPLLSGLVLLGLALGALVRGRAVARGVRVGWLVAAAGLLTAALSARVAVALGTNAVVHGWPGAGLSLMTGGLLVAAVLGVDGVQARVASHSFGWRQAAGGTAVLLAILAPLAVGASWGWQQRSPDPAAPGDLALRSVDPSVVPLVGRQGEMSANRQRVLELDVSADGTVSYQVYRGAGPELVETSMVVAARDLVGPPRSGARSGPDDAARLLAQSVADLSAGVSGDVSEVLGQFGIGVVIVPPALTGGASDPSARLVAGLDATLGLERIAQGDDGVLWRVAPFRVGQPNELVAARVRILDGVPTAAAALGTPLATVASGPVAVEGHVRVGTQARVVVLSERADRSWRARLDGRPLRSVAIGWRQGFELGSAGGTLTIVYAPVSRAPWLVLQAIVALVTLLLALPLRRFRGGRW